MSRSPLDKLIDEACGISDIAEVRSSSVVTLRCPCCLKEKAATRDETDPATAAVVLATCPDCGEVDDVAYLDAQGQPVDAEL